VNLRARVELGLYDNSFDAVSRMFAASGATPQNSSASGIEAENNR
jgi:hypothetical protein